MTYLPDTNVCVAYLRGQNANVTARFTACAPGNIALCDIVKAELYYGAHKSDRPTVNLIKVEAFFAPFVSLPFDADAASHFGRIRRAAEVAGKPIGPYDLLIAAIALSHGLTLVTHNSREFSRIANLQLVDWET